MNVISSLPISKPQKKPSLFFYCDETSHNQAGHMAVGGIAIRSSRIAEIKSSIKALRDTYGISSEVKWSHTRSGNKFNAYKAIVDLFFALNEANAIHYHCIIADNRRFDYAAVPNSSKQKMLPKMYYQLILHRFGRYYGSAFSLHVVPDSCQDLKKLPSWMSTLNQSIYDKYSFNDAIQSIHLRDSERCFMLQMNDIILGAIAYYKNERHLLPNASDAKKELALYILGKTGFVDYDFNTGRDIRKFTLWNLSSRHYRRSGS